MFEEDDRGTDVRWVGVGEELEVGVVASCWGGIVAVFGRGVFRWMLWEVKIREEAVVVASLV